MEIAEELILMGLRTQEGLSMARLRALGLRVDPASVADLLSDGMLDAAQAQAGRLVLSAAGRLLADAVAARLELVPEISKQLSGSSE
jgi:oxygen-independent coproporphyrinogen-3 oxidase